MKQVRIVTVLLILSAFGLGLLTLLLPERSVVSYTPSGFKLSLVLVAMIMVLQTGASALFLWGLQGFKQQTRIAYIIICIGIVMFGLSYVQSPIVTYLDQANGFWVRSGLVAIPFVLPIILFYIGVRQFATQFGLKSIWTSGWFALALSGGATVAAAALGFAAGSRIHQVLGSVVFVVWVSVILIIVDAIILQIRRGAGVIYKNPLGWFAIAMIIETISGLIFVVLSVLGTEAEATKTGLLDIPEVLGAFAFLFAGYYFKLINVNSSVRKPSNVSLIDIVVFTASQVSNPVQIDPLLDTLRTTTAQIQQENSQSLTPQQEAALRKVYLGVEQYLVTREPLRQFTASQIRQKIESNFGLNDQEFQAIIGQPAPAAT